MAMWGFALFALLSAIAPMDGNAIEPQLDGRLEELCGQRILFLKGSPYEIGFQHGSLLKEDIQRNIDRFTYAAGLRGAGPTPPVFNEFKKVVPNILNHIPEELIEEMHGIADGAGTHYNWILLLNLFPEMFHCTGITVGGEATASGELYHVRVLDYGAAQGIQETAVLTVVKPEKGLPFFNATYAGFIGCVTGINAERISIGQIGDKGYGRWDGVPMSFVLRHILQYATSLDDIDIFLKSVPRTCSHYYVFADGKSGQTIGYHASDSSLLPILPGTTYAKQPPPQNTYDPPSSLPSAVAKKVCQQLPDCVMITRGTHFDLLKERMEAVYGRIGIPELQEIIKRPVAFASNLHNVIFAPETLEMWIAHAGRGGEPACDQPYVHINLTTLLGD